MTHPKKVWHKDEKGWHSLIMEAVDANHAVNVDPANWAFEKPAENEPKSDRVALGPHPDQHELREIETDIKFDDPLKDEA